ncbi:MAG: hypothetical protein GYA55_02005 [SAR324 cluster bacterium]|uniref:Uncharacterized protein n=1 Tax=SAR324 cluster bacterium TaxID=2024889 RepID=A0A7X9FPJ9_9DELT|nr:hypothetical protein [SAR324 cluster bacterium]
MTENEVVMSDVINALVSEPRLREALNILPAIDVQHLMVDCGFFKDIKEVTTLTEIKSISEQHADTLRALYGRPTI